MSKVLTITLNPTIDKSTSIDKLLPEKKLRCAQPVFEPGGGGINVSRGLNRLGVDSVAFFPSGGRTGKLLQELLIKEQIKVSAIDILGETRENFIVVETSTNQQYRFGMPGAVVSAEEQQKILHSLNQIEPFPEFIVISGSLPPGMDPVFLREIVRTARKRGAKIIADTSGEALMEMVNEGVFLLKPNLGELANLVGTDSLDNESADEAAQKLIKEGKTELIVVSLGPQGAYLVSKGHSELIPAPTVKKRSTVGAGDSMVAGMVSVLARDGDVGEMVRMGVACGSAATMNAGTQLFKREDAERLFIFLSREKA